MVEHGMYYLKSEFYNVIRAQGGQWNDSKERPIVCLIKSVENDNLYWAIPVGDWDHRDEKAKQRIQSYINRDSKEIASCYYHLGNTNKTSIFFISDAVPLTDKYIERIYLAKNKRQYIILNKVLLSELQRKLSRILSYENGHPNYFRQHITAVKNYLLEELANNNNGDLQTE